MLRGEGRPRIRNGGLPFTIVWSPGRSGLAPRTPGGLGHGLLGAVTLGTAATRPRAMAGVVVTAGSALGAAAL